MASRNDYFAPGDWNVICAECGKKRKASELKRHWQGYYVCPEHWEPRQPQDFVRSVPDVQTPPWAQPRPADAFLAADWTRTFTESLTLTDDATAPYIDPSYFAEDYMTTVSFEKVVGKAPSDTVTLSDSGTLSLPPYIDATYFASDYIESSDRSF